MDRNSREFQALLRVHEGLPRQGPGSRDATARALSLLPPIREHARIYDLGCGPGLASIVLARVLQQKVIAVDLTDDFVRQVRDNAIKQGLSQQIDARCGDMIALDDPPDSIDLIWSEGAIYCVGFDNALRTWLPLLKKGGLVACTELSWLGREPSSDAVAFWQAAYPGMRSVNDNILSAEQLEYACLEHFTLPVSCWWDEYYEPLLRNIERLKPESKLDDALAQAIANASSEIDLFRRCNQEYGYVFYLLQKSGVSIKH